jgi:hypothetical protein
MPLPESGSNADLSGIISSEGKDFPESKPFRLVCFHGDPGQWKPETVDGVTVWLPLISHLRLREGVNGVRTLRPGQRAEDKVEVMNEIVARGGGVFIDESEAVPDSCLPPGGVSGSSALQVHKVIGGKQHFCLLWDEPRPRMRDGTFNAKHHRESYNRWLAWLVASGRIPAISEQVREQTIAALKRRAAAIATNAKSDPDADARATRTSRADARVAAANAAIDPKLMSDEPAPMKGRK